MSKIGEIGQINFYLKVSKNNFSQGYGHKFDQNSLLMGQFGQNRSFQVKMSQKPSFFGGKNDVICQNFGKVIKKFFTPRIEKLFQGGLYG